ncbi:MAG: hypothetical protein M1837_002647 [Sclerophora amabilis]|nr:MAG: hypothetical protein M1837_002647 [Sclerophora amabilis]
MIEGIEKAAATKEGGHPYLSGNFAPLQQVQPLTPCSHSGCIPEELCGGEYVRNGGNPVTNDDLGRDAHWFDGDGMLSGVAFRRSGGSEGGIQPQFVNQFILTDVYLSTLTTVGLRAPMLPSIATLVNPLSSLLTIVLTVARTILFVILSHLAGSEQAIKKISVANTSVIYHDGRALATCESGPPMRFALPGLETVGWYNGRSAEGENSLGEKGGVGFGGKSGLISFMKEWTTAHPRVDPRTKELILFHSTFIPPYVHYSIVPSTFQKSPTRAPRLLNAAVPGVSSAKMMHDFGVSPSHTVILDLPLSLDPINLARNRAVVSYDPSRKSRFGVFPRWQPEAVRWFETFPCCIFHTANTWDETTAGKGGQPQVTAVRMLACRLTSAALVFSAGNVSSPAPVRLSTLQEVEKDVDQCRLYYYRFDMTPSPTTTTTITHQFALSAIPFEFPSMRRDAQMTSARYVYGCSVSNATFGAALGRAAKIDVLAKIDVRTLVERGMRDPPNALTGSVDTRSAAEVLASVPTTDDDDDDDPIQLFKMPDGWFAQESQFVARADGVSEDDGWLLSYVFDESQLDPRSGDVYPDAKSELWIIDARNMRDVVAKIHLPQRVPYGLHGTWFSKEDVSGQRPVETIRALPASLNNGKTTPGTEPEDGFFMRGWMNVRRRIVESIG